MFTADVLFFLFCQGICKPHNLIAAKFCTMITSTPSFITPVQNFGKPYTKKILDAKTCKIWRDFGRLQNSAANISGKEEDIPNRTNVLSTTIHSALSEKDW